MPRRAKPERARSRIRTSRADRQRKQRASPENDPTDLTWLISIGQKMAASRILNGGAHPYSLSIEWGSADGTVPQSGYLPSSYFRIEDRVYYSFMFLEHRNAVFQEWQVEYNARKETRDSTLLTYNTKKRI